MEKKAYLIQWYDGEDHYHSAVASFVKVSVIEGFKTILETEDEG